MDSIEKAEIVDRATRSVKWSGLGSLLPRLITPISTLILAALLTPNDFGIVAICLSVINFAQIIVEMGIGKAIIQRRTDIAEAASVAFALNISLALAMCAGIWMFAPFFARVYGVAELVSPLRLSSLALVLSGFIGIPNALLTREMLFRRLFFVTILPQILTAFVSVGVALYRADYWAILMGYLVGNLAHAVVIWSVCSWRPKFIVNLDLARSILRFSAWILLSNLLSWLFLYADNLLVGYFMGPGVLGVYSLGFNLANLIPGMIVSSIAAVAYPAFSALQGDPKDVGEGLVKLQSLIAVVVFPVCFGLSAVGPQLVHLLYGAEWQGLPMVIMFLAIMPGLSHLWSLNADAYRAIGRPEIWTKVASLSLIILIPILIFVGRMKDLQLFVIARFLGAFLPPALNILYTRFTLGSSLNKQLGTLKTPLVSASVMYILVLVSSHLLHQYIGFGGWTILVVVILAGIVCYFAIIRLSNRSLWDSLWFLAGRTIRAD